MITITSKNQITIPKYIVDELNAEMGDKLIVSLKDNLITLRPIKSVMDDLYGSLSIPKHLKGKDIDEVINESKLKRFSTHNS